MKTSLKIIVIFALIIGGIGIGRLSTHIDRLFGRSFSQASPEDVRELQRLSYLAAPAITAIEDFRIRNGHYPQSMNALSTHLPPGYLDNTFHEFGGPYPSFIYYTDDDAVAYTLFMKLNWEGTLSYQGHGRWTYRQEMTEWEVIPEKGRTEQAPPPYSSPAAGSESGEA